jgi:hypothetical protein
VLGVNAYDQSYIDDCRVRMEEQLAAYEQLVLAATGPKGAGPAGRTAVETFEPRFLNHLVLALDDYFVHRLRTKEGKDGNPLNEVRMLCTSILHNGNVLAADKTIKYRPEQSVLKLQLGDEIRLDLARFTQLFHAYFAEIELKFGK